MNFSEKVDLLYNASGLTQKAFAERAGITPASLNAILKGKTSSISVSTAQKIADTYSVTLDYLMRDEITDPNYGRRSEVEPSYDEGEMLKKYRFIAQDARDVVNVVLNFEYDRAKKNPSPVALIASTEELMIELPVLASTAAGTPVELLGDLLSGEVERISVPASVDADFCLRVSGDSMEPDIPNGSIIAIKSQNDLYDGDYAVFYMNNELTCKIFCKKDTHIELRSVNNTYPPLIIESEMEVRIVGRVMRVHDHWFVSQ